jgi:hypothetical protein
MSGIGEPKDFTLRLPRNPKREVAEGDMIDARVAQTFTPPDPVFEAIIKAT